MNRADSKMNRADSKIVPVCVFLCLPLMLNAECFHRKQNESDFGGFSKSPGAPIEGGVPQRGHTRKLEGTEPSSHLETLKSTMLATSSNGGAATPRPECSGLPKPGFKICGRARASPSAKSVACRATDAGQTDAALHLCGLLAHRGGWARRTDARARLRVKVDARHMRGWKKSIPTSHMRWARRPCCSAKATRCRVENPTH